MASAQHLFITVPAEIYGGADGVQRTCFKFQPGHATHPVPGSLVSLLLALVAPARLITPGIRRRPRRGWRRLVVSGQHHRRSSAASSATGSGAEALLATAGSKRRAAVVVAGAAASQAKDSAPYSPPASGKRQVVKTLMRAPGAFGMAGPPGGDRPRRSSVPGRRRMSGTSQRPMRDAHEGRYEADTSQTIYSLGTWSPALPLNFVQFRRTARRRARRRRGVIITSAAAA